MPGPSFQDATAIATDNGLRTQYGVILPPGARVAAYVRSIGFQSGDDEFLAENLVASLAVGLARVRAGLGDFVICLPGHVENVVDGTTFSGALLAGTKIIGVGKGSNTPTFTWTATASQWAIAVNDVQIAGLRLLFDGINAVVTPIAITGSDVSLVGNEMQVASAAKAPTLGITVAATAARCQISANYFRGLASSVVGQLITITGANLDSSIEDNVFNCAVTAATGHVTVSGAALGLRIQRNTMYNTAALSTVCISFAAAASDGMLVSNYFGVLNNGTASAQGVTFGAGCLVKAFQNFCSDQPQLSGILAPGPAT